jgi:hypothetical protein
MEPRNLREALVVAAHQIDREVDWRQQLKSCFLLVLCAFSLFFLFMAPFEMWQVHDARAWRPLPARLVKVSHERSAFRPHILYWRYDIELKETGQRVTTSDVRPGDLPISAMGWSSSDDDAARYHDGQELAVFRSPEGGKVFLERGDFGQMAMIFATSLAFWLVMIARMMKRRAQEASINGTS